MQENASTSTLTDRADEPLPDLVGYSLANVAELMYPCMEAAGVKSVLEIGAFHGALTRELLAWADAEGAKVTAVDPEPPSPLLALEERHPELDLIRETSHDAIRELPRHDAVIIDGDHNYHTVSQELRLIDQRSPGAELPLLLFHDVAWPHARRDTYYAPDRIPEEHRQPLAHKAQIAPEEPGLADSGLLYEWAAAREGGPANGVLTAIEDFVAERDGLRLAIVPAFFGFGILWHESVPWAEAVTAVVDAWDRNPLIARLEENRVSHLVARVGATTQLAAQAAEIESLRRELEDERRRQGDRIHLLRAMLGSRAFAVGERISRFRNGGQPVFSREMVRRALGH